MAVAWVTGGRTSAEEGGWQSMGTGGCVSTGGTNGPMVWDCWLGYALPRPLLSAPGVRLFLTSVSPRPAVVSCKAASRSCGMYGRLRRCAGAHELRKDRQHGEGLW